MSFSLRSISDHDVLTRTRDLVARERALTIDVLLHLNEIERRRLHLKQGYASMFDYCTTGLGYSASAAARRIRTARCIARFPGVLDLLQSNDVNLSTVAMASRIMNPKNQHALLARIRGKSQRDVAAIVAEYEPRTAVREVVRPVAVLVKSAPTGATEDPLAHVADPMFSVATEVCENIAYCRSGSESGEIPQAESHTPAPAETTWERRMLLQFSASEAFMTKVEQVRAIAWHRLPANASLEQVFDLALDVFLEKEDPSARNARREEKRAASASASVAMPAAKAAETFTKEPASGPAARPRKADAPRREHVPARVRDAVFVRDRSQCTYTAPNGHRCATRHALQVDHVVPVARGGPSTPTNLRLLCAHHNRIEAERLMGHAGTRHGPGG